MVIVSREDALARGLVRFFTGVACTRGHVCERNAKAGYCCECNANNTRAHESTPEGRAAKNAGQRAYYARLGKPHVPKAVSPRAEAIAKGLPWYATGVPCKRGHLSERNTKTSSCRECDRTPEPRRDRKPVPLRRDRTALRRRMSEVLRSFRSR